MVLYTGRIQSGSPVYRQLIESFYLDYQQKKHILISFGCSLFIRSSWLEMHSRHHKCNPDVNLTASRCHSGHRWPQCTGSKKRWPQSAKVSYFPTSNHSWPARKNADWWQWSNHKQWCTDRDPIKSSIFKSKCQHLECLDTSSQFEIFHKQLYGLCP